MKVFGRILLLLVASTIVCTAVPGLAGDRDPLFINLTTDEPHRASMGIVFGRSQLERGHPLTIFLNDRGVFLGSKAESKKFADLQKELGELLSKGAVVVICPYCMKHYGIKEPDVLTGLKLGNPGLTGDALFRENTKTLTW